MTAQKNRRWMKSILTQAAQSDTQMPWARGARRAEMIARRDAQAAQTAAQQMLRRA